MFLSLSEVRLSPTMYEQHVVPDAKKYLKKYPEKSTGSIENLAS